MGVSSKSTSLGSSWSDQFHRFPTQKTTDMFFFQVVKFRNFSSDSFWIYEFTNLDLGLKWKFVYHIHRYIFVPPLFPPTKPQPKPRLKKYLQIVYLQWYDDYRAQPSGGIGGSLTFGDPPLGVHVGVMGFNGFWTHDLSSKTINILKSLMDVQWFLESKWGEDHLANGISTNESSTTTSTLAASVGALQLTPQAPQWFTEFQLDWRLSPFGFHFFWWASHSFFCNIAKEPPWQLERKSKKRPTGASWKFMIVTSFFFGSGKDIHRRIIALLFPPIKGRACWMLAKPSSRTQLTLKFLKDVIRFGCALDQKHGVRKNSISTSTSSGWWLNQPIWQIWVKLDHFPR